MRTLIWVLGWWPMWAWAECTEEDPTDCAAACAAGEAEACLIAADSNPTSGERVDWLVRACERGTPEHCLEAGQTLRDGPTCVTDYDDESGESATLCSGREHAAVALASACRRGLLVGCQEGARLAAEGLEAEPELGAAVPRQPSLALELYQKACALGDQAACTEAAQGATALEALCGPKDLRACARLGMQHARAGDFARANPLLLGACDGGQADACAWLGRHFELGRGAKKDQDLANEFLRRACEAQLCASWGRVHEFGRGVPKSAEVAAGMYKAACDHGEMLGCTYLGLLHERGIGVKADGARAAELHARACQAQEALSCHRLALQLEKGRGVPADPVRAQTLRRQACDLGHAEACAPPAAP